MLNLKRKRIDSGSFGSQSSITTGWRRPLGSTDPFSSKTLPIMTLLGYIIALLAGCPDNSSWDTSMQELARTMDLMRDAMCFDEEHAQHRRGLYASVNTGISYGGSTKVCHFVQPSHFPKLLQAPGKLGPRSNRRKQAVNTLLSCKPLKALSGYTSSGFDSSCLNLT